MKNHCSFTPLVALTVLTLAGFACSISPKATPPSSVPLLMAVTSTPTLPKPATIPETINTPMPMASKSASEATLFYACSLISKEEAAAMLGEPAEIRPAASPGSCMYVTSSTTNPRTLTIGAAQGEEAKKLTLSGIQALLMLSGSQDAQMIYEELQIRAPTMTIQELIDNTAKMFDLVGYTIKSVPGISDLAIWAANDKYGIWELLVTKGDAYLFVAYASRESAPNLEAIKALAQQALGRLPPKFTVPGLR